MKKFILFGVGGYIAPRHLKAIKDTGNKLIAAFDINDSVGIMDSYFPKAKFFIDIAEFKKFVDEYIGKGNQINFAAICSPNNLHKAQIKFCLDRDINVICEKPLVLHEKDIDDLQEYEKSSKAKVSTILQLRLHQEIEKLKANLKQDETTKKDIELTYITSRGDWYLKSWKGDIAKSGGLATNIGIHFFDMLGYVFGNHIETSVHENHESIVSGTTEYKYAKVKWFLSIDSNYLPDGSIENGNMTYRSIKIDGNELEFSSGFTELHTESYRRIINKEGYGLEDNRMSLQIVEMIRNDIPKKN